MSDIAVVAISVAVVIALTAAAIAIAIWLRGRSRAHGLMPRAEIQALLQGHAYTALMAKIDLLGKQIELGGHIERPGSEQRDIALHVKRLEDAIESVRNIASALEHTEDAIEGVRNIAVALERTAHILERDGRLDDAQRAKISRIRAKIAHGIAVIPAQSGSSGEGDG